MYRTLTEELVQNIGSAIIVGDYPENCTIPTEKELCRVYCVSRTVAREAVKILSAKGMVIARKSQGTKVQPERAWDLFDRNVLSWILDKEFSFKVFNEFCEVRTAIEPAAAYYAAQRINYESCLCLQKCYRALADAVGGFGSIIEQQIRFHQCVLKISQNSVFMGLDNFICSALRYRHEYESSKFDRYQVSIESYREVYMAILNNDAEMAHGAMRRLDLN